MKTHHPDTIAVDADFELNDSGAMSPPIYQTSTFIAHSAEEFAEMATEPRHPGFYARYGTPNHAQAERIIADLEGAEAALVTATGMGAITTTVLTLVSQGDHIVAQNNHYAGTLALLEKLLPRFGVTVAQVDQTDLAAFEAAIRPATKLIIVESPVNPLMTITDLRGVVALAQARGILTLADNTFATPINQRPLDLGCDLVVHSATKYLGGHSDLMAGVVAGRAEMIERIWRASLITGATLNSFDSWLLVRGLRTLPLRIEKHNQNALAVAQALAQHPHVETVYFPGLESHPQRDLARAQMSGFGGMVSFQVRGGFAETNAFIAALRLIVHASSLGGVHSNIVHPAAMWAATFSEAELIDKGILPNLVRLSVGIENAQDLIADLVMALDSAR
jgi:cystathionine beta-lyase/cystathionine gamma-synthase